MGYLECYLYLDGDYTMAVNESAKVKLSGQYIHEQDIGGSFAGSVDTNYFAGKITGIYDDFSAYVALLNNWKQRYRYRWKCDHSLGWYAGIYTRVW